MFNRKRTLLDQTYLMGNKTSQTIRNQLKASGGRYDKPWFLIMYRWHVMLRTYSQNRRLELYWRTLEVKSFSKHHKNISGCLAKHSLHCGFYWLIKTNLITKILNWRWIDCLKYNIIENYEDISLLIGHGRCSIKIANERRRRPELRVMVKSYKKVEKYKNASWNFNRLLRISVELRNYEAKNALHCLQRFLNFHRN